MKNQEKWTPSKYVSRGERLTASRDRREVSAASRLVTDLIAEQYQTHIPRHAAGILVDLGCGKVPLFAAYRKYVTDVICIDWSNSIHNNEHLDYTCDLSQQLCLPSEFCNTLMVSDVLEHIREPRLLWLEMARILQVNGKILMNVPFYYRIHEAPHDYFRYTEFALQMYAEEAGFEILVLKPIGGMLDVLADLLAKAAVHIPSVGESSSVFVQSAAHFLRNRNPWKRLNLRSASEFPLGYFMVAQKVSKAHRNKEA